MEQQKVSWWDKTKPWLGGIVIAAIVVPAAGFWFFGWTTNGAANDLANKRVDAAMKVVAVNLLAPMCAEIGAANPEALAAISTASSFQRSNEITKAGWATFEGFELSSSNTRALADACGKLLFDQAA